MQASVNGIGINYRLEGPEGAPCIVLSHGLGLDLTMWDGFVDRVGQRFRTLRYDSRGHGGSQPGPGPFSIGDLGEDVIALIDSLQLGRPNFLGLSMGGMVGLGLALNHPGRFCSFAICDARGIATPDYRDSWIQRIAAVERGGIDTIVESSVTRWFTEAFLQSQPRTIDAIKSIVKNTSSEGYCRSALALCELDYGHRIGEVKAPLLFLTGDQDRGAPPQVVRAMHEAAPGSCYVELSHAGHISVVEQPDAFVAATTCFFNKDVEPAGGF